MNQTTSSLIRVCVILMYSNLWSDFRRKCNRHLVNTCLLNNARSKCSAILPRASHSRSQTKGNKYIVRSNVAMKLNTAYFLCFHNFVITRHFWDNTSSNPTILFFFFKTDNSFKPRWLNCYPYLPTLPWILLEIPTDFPSLPYQHSSVWTRNNNSRAVAKIPASQS